MHYRSSIGLIAFAAALTIVDAHAFDETKYPDWTGQWVRIGAGTFDPTKAPGRGQQAPLTAVSGRLGGEPGGHRRRRSGQQSDGSLPAAGHAADDDQL